MIQPTQNSSLAEVLAFEAKNRTKESLPENLGDGLLCKTNPVFRSVRKRALQAEFSFSVRDTLGYYGWPLVHLDRVLQKRKIVYRNNRSGLEHLESSRPGYFKLKDLNKNRPSPNYVLHEAAHAVAYRQLFGRPRSAQSAMAHPPHLGRVVLGEAYAMATEYFAACCLSSPLEEWFFSINSYRHRVPGKRILGQLLEERGIEQAGSLVLAAFLGTNLLKTRISTGELNRLLSVQGYPELPPAMSRKVSRALGEVMQMNPDFLRNTTRLFLGSLGYSRNIDRLLNPLSPLSVWEDDETIQRSLGPLISAWGL